jgi:hypothetical protein
MVAYAADMTTLAGDGDPAPDDDDLSTSITDSPTIGRLVRVPLRQVWAHEAGNFTPRLLANAEVLGEAESELRWVFDLAATAIGVDGLTPHELRHTCASLAIAAGANIKVLQTLLGHKTATLTLDRYGHLFPDDLGRIAGAFDAAAEDTADWLRTGPSLRAVPSDGDKL